MKIEKICTDCFRKQAKAILDLSGAFRKQASESLDLSNASEDARNQIGLWLDKLFHCLPADKPPSYIGRMIQRRIEAITGVVDPYRELKRKTNEFALGLFEGFRTEVLEEGNPIIAALRLSAAGNIIDFGAKRDLKIEEASEVIHSALRTPLIGGVELEASKRLANASKVLIIGDNAGEIVFDRILCEVIPARPVYAVRSAAIINDATMEDAKHSGITAEADVIEAGSDLPGLMIECAGEEFLSHYRAADVIISKGQGNYEGLSDVKFPGYFLFRVKCEPVAASCGHPVDTNVLLKAD